MANRPCRTDADLKRLWQLLLPGTPAPACNAPENSVDEARDNAARPTHADEKLQLKSGTH
jgi:hypothetical protein